MTLAAAAFSLLLLASAGPAYRLGVPLPTAFSLLRWAAYAGAASALLAAGAAFVAYRGGKRLPATVAILAVAGGLVAFAIPYQWQWRAGRVPPIHDITTDLENPPEFEAIIPLRADAPNTLDRPADLADRQRQGYPGLEPVTLADPLDRAFDRALALAQSNEWEIVTADKSAGRIEATDTTRWFGFKDDVVVRLTPWGAGTRVDMRSVSRVGQSDVGTNARRIEEFLEQLSDS